MSPPETQAKVSVVKKVRVFQVSNPLSSAGPAASFPGTNFFDEWALIELKGKLRAAGGTPESPCMVLLTAV